MDIISAYREVGTYRGAAEIAGTTPKTVKRVIERHEAGGGAPERAVRGHNYDGVVELVATRVVKTAGRISAKRLLPAARAAGYAGSPRNFRRLVAAQKQLWRNDNHRGRRPAVWSPGEHLVIDWGVLGGLHVFCAVLAWCRLRFVRFATDERAETTLGMLAECFEVLGGVPGTVLADRMALRFTQRLADAGIAPSTGSVGDSFDNALAENLWSTLKTELIYWAGTEFTSRAQAEATLLRYIDGWYNPHRIQHRLGGLSPDEYEDAWHRQPGPATLHPEPDQSR